MRTVSPPHCAIAHMSPVISVAASLSSATRKEIGIKAVARTVPISHLVDQHQVSRKFVYQQGDKAQRALDESFAPSQGDDDVLFAIYLTCRSALAPSTIGSNQRRRGHQKSIKAKTFLALRWVFRMRFFSRIARC